MNAHVKGIFVVGLAVGLASCADEAPQLAQITRSQVSFAGSGKVGLMLRTLMEKGPAPDQAARAMPKGLVSAHGRVVNGQKVTVVDLLLRASLKALPKLAALGVEVRTITRTGIMTASAPLSAVPAIAALGEVSRVEGARRVKMWNDNSNGLACPALEGGGSETCKGTVGMNNPRTPGIDGTGVVVGVIDSGLDWNHPDFKAADGSSRIAFYWDQSDTTDDRPPAGWSYGHEYTAADFAGGTIKDSAKDTNGHGTHVTGTAAGNGAASGGKYMGAASRATIVFVKFDFDGDRNTDAAIIDGVDYIFKKAGGAPAVINMSLGSDYGPHDGSTLEERAIDDLTGPGKLVVVAAGNPGTNNWSGPLAWGYSLHGKGELGVDPISFRFPKNLVVRGNDADYAFLDIWHNSPTPCGTVTVTLNGSPICTLSGTTAEGRVGICRTSAGDILVGQSKDVLGYKSSGGQYEVYVELPPVTATWGVTFAGCTGEYHAWYGASENVTAQWKLESPRRPTPRFGACRAGRECACDTATNECLSDNAYTIGNPASASRVIAVGAYLSRRDWSYVFGPGPEETNPVCSATPRIQRIGDWPIHYYDPFDLGEISYFSARGPRRDDVVKPDISTPGVGIISAFSGPLKDLELAANKCTSYWSGGPYSYGTNRVLPGEMYRTIQGTSMACPNATGAIALLLQQKADLTDGCLRQLFAGSARGALDTAVATYDNNPFTSGTDTDSSPAVPNNDWGYGKLDIGNASSTVASLAITGCTSNAGCSGGQICLPSPTSCGASCAACTADAQCDAGGVCCGGACVMPVCHGDADCTAPLVCSNAGACGAACVAAPTCQPAGQSCAAAPCCAGLTCGTAKGGAKVCKAPKNPK